MFTQRPEMESFSGLLLRHRGRTGLTQRELADRIDASVRTVENWEGGVNYPSAKPLQALIAALLESGGLTVGQELDEARELWTAVLRHAPRMHTPLDEVWLAAVLAERSAPQTAQQAFEVVPAQPAIRAADVGGVERRQDWGESPDVIGFVGRTEELATLREWVLEEHCRLAAVLGIGGIGKTALASRLAQDTAPSFLRVYWRSLRDALPAGDWMAGAIGFLSAHLMVPPEGEVAQLAVLLQLLRDQPSLLVLDNFETVLEPGDREGRYRDGFAGYGALLQAVGETRHQSCLLVTSREAPPELAVLDGGRVRRFQLGGLGVPEGQVLLTDKQLAGNDDDWANLIARFGGNGLALKVVGESISQVFGGDIGMFLEQSGSATAFGGIRRLLTEQIERSSALEQKLLRVLAVEREPMSVAELIASMGPRIRHTAVLEAVEALRRRSLVERAGTAAFTLQSVVLEYVTDRLVEEVGDEIARGQPLQLVEQPFIKAQAKEYLRQTQESLIGEPILQRLNAESGRAGAEQRLLALLDVWRNRPDAEQGYGPGNVVNLLRLGRGDLCNLDLAHLALRQAYLAGVEAQDASLAGSHLAEAVLAEAFNVPSCVALSSDGAAVVAGMLAGEVWLWRVADRTPLLVVQGHSGPVHCVVLSADGRLLVSGGEDGTVRLWEAPVITPGVASGGSPATPRSDARLVATLVGHTGAVRSLGLSADGGLLASGSYDGTIRLWEVRLATLGSDEQFAGRSAGCGGASPAPTRAEGTVHPNVGRLLATLEGHAGPVYGVALSADGQLLASGGWDGTIRLWDPRSASSAGHGTSNGRLLATLEAKTHAGAGRAQGVWVLALSTDGRLLASGGLDGTVRLWETDGGGLLTTLQAHAGPAYALALSADGRLLVSGSIDGAIRLWDARSAQPLATLQGHSSHIHSVALSANAQLLASGSWDGTVRLWDVARSRPLATLQAQGGGIRNVALTADGQLLASGAQDGTVRLWEAGSGRLLATAQGSGLVSCVALSADGRLLASGSLDGTVRLWESPNGRQVASWQGHAGAVYGVAVAADGQLLATGSLDGTVRLWRPEITDAADPAVAPPRGGWRLQATLQGHTSAVRSVALSTDGRVLASGGLDAVVRLWDVTSGRALAALQGHGGQIHGVALSADAQLVASGSWDGTIRLWDVPNGRPLGTLPAQAGGVRSVALTADGQLLASGGRDGTIRLWQPRTGQLLATLQGHTSAVWGVALSMDGRLLGSGALDGTVRLWETSTGACLRILRSDRRYERLDITGLTGVTAAQRATLLTLGAVDHEAPAGDTAEPAA